MFLQVSTIAFKLITLLLWDLENQFGIGYWYWLFTVITNTVN